MRPLLAFVFLLSVSGCDAYRNQRSMLLNYRCNPEHADAVERLFKICNESDYTSSSCYLHAVSSICEYLEAKP